MHMTLLASRGITGPLAVLEGPQGWEESVGDRIESDWEKEPLDRFWHSCVKRYNAEGHTQSVLECVLEMREMHRIRPADVVRVEVEVFKQALNIVGGGVAGDRTVVESKEQADHSLPWLCAVALLDGDVWPQQLSSSRARREDVQRLMRRVWVRQREEMNQRYPNEMPCRVTMLLKDGSELSAEKSDYQGFWRTRPLEWNGAAEKFERLTEPHTTSALRREIEQAVEALDGIPVRELVELLARAGRADARARAAG